MDRLLKCRLVRKGMIINRRNACIALLMISLALPAAAAAPASSQINPTENDRKKIRNQLSTYTAYQFCLNRLGNIGDPSTSMVLAISDVRQKYSLLVQAAGEPETKEVTVKAKNFCPYAFDQVYRIKPKQSAYSRGSSYTRASAPGCQVSQSDLARLTSTGSLTRVSRECMLKVGD